MKMVNSLKLLIAVSILLLIIGISLLGKRLRFFLDFKRVSLRKNESFWILIFSIILIFVTASIEYFRFISSVSLITIIGLLFFFIAVLLQFFVIKQNIVANIRNELKQVKGLYSKIRYPGYSALSLLLLSFCLVFNSLWGVMMFIMLYLPALLYRIAQEDTFLADSNENEFALYSAETKKIIPGVF